MAPRKKVDEATGLPLGTLDQLLTPSEPEQIWVDLPELGCKVEVKALSKAEQMKLRKQATTRGKVDDTKMEALLLVYGVVQPKLSLQHVEEMFKQKFGIVDKLLSAILTASGMDGALDEEAEADFPE